MQNAWACSTGNASSVIEVAASVVSAAGTGGAHWNRDGSRRIHYDMRSVVFFLALCASREAAWEVLTDSKIGGPPGIVQD
jgi:hypothetical protein